MIENFSSNNIFEYNKNEKKKFLIITFLIFLTLIIFSIYYYLSLKHSNFILIKLINSFLLEITYQIKNLSLLGSFYISLFGGLFFIFMPLELVFIKFIRSGINPLLLILIYIFGLFISYNVNYYLGFKLREFSQKIITHKKFYNIKGMVNKYGSLAIFVFNALPLPSQPLSAILGVFRYNIYRFYLFFILGQLTKYILIAITYLYIFK